jgi:ribonuclease P protein component
VVFSSLIKIMKNAESLKKNRDFQIVYKKGKSFANRLLVMYIRKNNLDKNRIGISVSKKVGNSIVRHRLTRLIRESYRLNELLFVNGLDMVVVVRPQAKGKTFFDIESALLHLSKIHHIVGIDDENNIDQGD